MDGILPVFYACPECSQSTRALLCLSDGACHVWATGELSKGRGSWNGEDGELDTRCPTQVVFTVSHTWRQWEI